MLSVVQSRHSLRQTFPETQLSRHDATGQRYLEFGQVQAETKTWLQPSDWVEAAAGPDMAVVVQSIHRTNIQNKRMIDGFTYKSVYILQSSAGTTD